MHSFLYRLLFFLALELSSSYSPFYTIFPLSVAHLFSSNFNPPLHVPRLFLLLSFRSLARYKRHLLQHLFCTNHPHRSSFRKASITLQPFSSNPPPPPPPLPTPSLAHSHTAFPHSPPRPCLSSIPVLTLPHHAIPLPPISVPRLLPLLHLSSTLPSPRHM